MSGICQNWGVRITRAGRSPSHKPALAPAAEGAQVAVTDVIKTTGGTAVAGPGIVSEGEGT